uniref:(northern house mosquito) hypothetical protein n=1 Tax=Culex pipiens TaxID=7175 RepID=A0A8D8CI17_CULPI
MLRSTNISSNSQTSSNLKFPSWVYPAMVCRRPRRRRRWWRPIIPTVLAAIRCRWPDCNSPPGWRRSTVWPAWLVLEWRSNSNSQQCNYLRFQVKANSSSSSSTKWVESSRITSTPPATCPFTCQRVEPRSEEIRKRTRWPGSLTRWSTRWPRSRRATQRRWD